MICSGLCFLPFIVSLLARFGPIDSHTTWISFRGAGQTQMLRRGRFMGFESGLANPLFSLIQHSTLSLWQVVVIDRVIDFKALDSGAADCRNGESCGNPLRTRTLGVNVQNRDSIPSVEHSRPSCGVNQCRARKVSAESTETSFKGYSISCDVGLPASPANTGGYRCCINDGDSQRVGGTFLRQITRRLCSP